MKNSKLFQKREKKHKKPSKQLEMKNKQDLKWIISRNVVWPTKSKNMNYHYEIWGIFNVYLFCGFWCSFSHLLRFRSDPQNIPVQLGRKIPTNTQCD